MARSIPRLPPFNAPGRYLHQWLGIFAVILASQAEASRHPELAKLDLEGLLNLTVSTASKLPSTASDSPGIITVYTAEEIELFGGRDLSEILARIPGLAPYTSVAGNRYRITARSDAPRVNNNHILMLVNGIPFNRESYSGGLWTQAVMTTFPLDAIRQIEVIRGPGSVLYGTNAYSGVINIITKRANELEDRISIGAGDNGAVAAGLSLGAESANNDSEIVTALRYSQTDGETLSMHDNSGEFRTRLEETTPGGLVSARHQGFHATVHWGRSDLDDIRGSQLALAEGHSVNERTFIDLGYDYQLNANWQGKINVSHVRVRTELQEPTVGVFGPINYRTDDSRVEVQLQGRFSDDLQLVTGLTYDTLLARVDEPYPFLPRWRNDLYAAYAQLEYQWQNTRFIGGLQLNKAEGISSNTSPRIGIIQHFDEAFGAKLMYAEAFRAPYALEQDVAIVTPALSLIGNPALEHETVKTWDFQLFYNLSSFQSAITFYHTEQDNLIVRQPQSPGVISFFNEDQLETEGVELEAKYIPHPNWYVSGAASWQHSENQDGTKDTTLQPDYVVKVGVGYRNKDWSLALFDNYHSHYQDNVVVTPSRSELNPPAEGIHNISLNGTLTLAQLNQLKLKAYTHNLLNEDFWLPAAPGFTTSTLNTLPSVENGRTFLITAELPL